jgi:hypothetical protein
MISSRRLTLIVVSLAIALFGAGSASAQCTTAFASQPSPPGGDQIYIDDAIPGYASVGAGTLTWDTNQYATGSQSFVLSGSGTQTVQIIDLHEFHKFGSGKAVFYALIDECDTTSQIKVTYESAYRKAAVYWGSNSIGGESGITQFNRGSLPSAGVWTRFEIPISSPLALRGHEVVKVKFQIYNGHVWFDHVGTDGVGCTPSTASAPSISSGGTVWIDDSIPGGSYMSYGEAWTTQAASGTVSFAYPYFGQTATGPVRVNDLNQSIPSGDNLFLYVMPTSCETLKELKISWFSGADYSTAGCIWYGSTTPAPAIGGEGSCTFISSTLPANNTWTRIEIPASTVGMDGATITSFKVENIGSQVWVDYVGNITPP